MTVVVKIRYRGHLCLKLELYCINDFKNSPRGNVDFYPRICTLCGRVRYRKGLLLSSIPKCLLSYYLPNSNDLCS